jgi:hypothetical protein
MKKAVLIILGVFVLLYAVTRNYNTNSQVSFNQNYKSEVGNKLALDVIKREPKVKEAIITEANVLYVSVIDDGTRRDGFASYLCEILREKNAKADRVKVVKVNSTNDPNRDNSYGVLLGESWCN